MSAQGAQTVDDTVEGDIGTVRQSGARAVEREAPAREEREEMPLPTEPRTIFLGGLFLLAMLTALYVAAEIVLPVVLAIVLKLLLQPLVRLMDRLRVPHSLGAVLAIGLLVTALAALVSGIAGPAVLVGREAAGRDPATAAEARFPGAPNRLAPMDVRATGGHYRWRDRSASGSRAPLL